MTVLVESPWPATIVALVLLIVFGTIFVRTGRPIVLVAMALVVVALAGMVALEQVVVTDREEVEDTLHGIADDLEANDVPAVMASFAPHAPRRSEAQRVLEDVTIRSASIGRDLEVRINKLTSPPTATVFFTGHINVNARESAGRRFPSSTFSASSK